MKSQRKEGMLSTGVRLELEERCRLCAKQPLSGGFRNSEASVGRRGHKSWTEILSA